MERNPRGRPRHPDVLTPGEWRVLEQLREGGTNAEIASRLGISTDAVKYHISNMLGKLELRDRRALAAWRPERRRRLGGLIAIPATLESLGRSVLWVGAGAAALAGVAAVAVALVLLEVVVEEDGALPAGVEPPVSATSQPLLQATHTPTATPPPTATPSLTPTPGPTLAQSDLPPEGSPAAREECTKGWAVAPLRVNAGLINDCAILLDALDVLAPHGDPPNWGSEVDIDRWQGVTVAGAPPRVTSLQLWNRDFRGVLPSELGKLAMLEELDLRGNALAGPVPPSLALLVKLQHLDLSNNNLTGEIPPELAALTSLRTLYLGGNRLTGGIPTGLAALSNLWTLDLNGNLLTGEIRADLSSVRGPRDVRLHRNDLSGCIPLSMRRSLSTVTLLGLPYCECPAASPLDQASAGDFATDEDGVPLLPMGFLGAPAGRYRIGTSLVVDLPTEGRFWVARPWDGDRTAPITIIEADSHSHLVLDPLTGIEQSRATVEGPPGCVSPAGLFDKIVASVRVKAPSLDPDGIRGIGLGETMSGGGSYRLDPEWRWWPRFVIDIPQGMQVTLVLVHCDRSVCGYGYVLEDDATGSTLSLDETTGEELRRDINEAGRVSGTHALFDTIVASAREDPPAMSCGSDPTPPDCILLLGMQATVAGGASLNWGAGVEEWEGVTLSRWTGRVISLHLKGLNGELPGALGRLEELEYLSVADGQLTGGIPAELGSLTNLKSLDLSGNLLSGHIPAALGQLRGLERLDLSRNQLTGGLPPELGSLVNLRTLILSENDLSGQIPVEFEELLFLRRLSLDREKILGETPPGLGRLSYLVEFSLEF